MLFTRVYSLLYRCPATAIIDVRNSRPNRLFCLASLLVHVQVDLYVGKELVQKGIPNEQACDALIDLIKANDRWVDKEPAEEAVAA